MFTYIFSNVIRSKSSLITDSVAVCLASYGRVVPASRISQLFSSIVCYYWKPDWAKDMDTFVVLYALLMLHYFGIYLCNNKHQYFIDSLVLIVVDVFLISK